MVQIAIIIPIYNEEKTIREVLLDFYNYLSKTEYNFKLYIIDNNSNDSSNTIAKQTIIQYNIPGTILFVKKQGKANAIREAFYNINAEVYVIVDGDSTYWANDLPKLLQPILTNQADMVIGNRLSSGIYQQQNKRLFHEFGNSLVKNLINFLFKANIKDVMTGYRACNNRFVKNYPIVHEGFELETDITIFALYHRLNIIEVDINYSDRPIGSQSKLNTYRDGLKVIIIIFNLFRNYKPLQFFASISLLLLIGGLISGTFPLVEYFRYHYVYKVPTAILAVSLVILSFSSLFVGLILDNIKTNQLKMFELRLLDESKIKS